MRGASTYPVAGALWTAAPDGLLGLPAVLSSLPAPGSHLQRLPSSLVGAKVSLIQSSLCKNVCSLWDEYVCASVSGKFSFSRACKPHYCKLIGLNGFIKTLQGEVAKS